MRHAPAKHPLHVTLQNTKSKYLKPMEKVDPDSVLPTFFVFQDMRGSGKGYSCVQMCCHFKKKGYIQCTFLLCPMAMEGDKNQKETIYVNLKTVDQKDVYTDIHAFEKDLYRYKNVSKQIR